MLHFIFFVRRFSKVREIILCDTLRTCPKLYIHTSVLIFLLCRACVQDHDHVDEMSLQVLHPPIYVVPQLASSVRLKL